DAREAVERVDPDAVRLPDHVARDDLRLEESLRVAGETVSVGEVVRLLVDAGGVLEAAAQVRVAGEHLGVGDAAVDRAGERELVVAGHVAENDGRAAVDAAPEIIGGVADRGTG